MLRQIDFRPRSASFSLFRRRLQASHMPHTDQARLWGAAALLGMPSPLLAVHDALRWEARGGKGSLQLLVISASLHSDVIITHILRLASPGARKVLCQGPTT